MRSVTRVAAYLPPGSAGGSRVGGADEDAFTLAAVALERAMGDGVSTAEGVELHLVGEFPPMADWGFPALLGSPVKIVRHAGTAEELQRTIRALEAEDGGPAIAVVAELPERVPSNRPTAAVPVGAGSVAYLLSASDRPLAFPFEPFAPQDSALALAFRRPAESREPALAAAFVGDWDADPSAGRPIDRAAVLRAANRDTSAVSEGAYLPRARYLENVPSRWRFALDECDACHALTFPARGVCRHCRRQDALRSTTLPRDGGRIVAITTIGPGGQPTEFDAQVEASGPYPVAIVELSRGPRVTLPVADARPGELKVGDRVNTRLRRLYPMEGEWRYGRKAIPAVP